MISELNRGESKRELLLSSAILLVVLMLPFPGILSGISVIILGLVWILQKHYKNFRLLLNLNFAVFFLFYLLLVIGLIYTEDFKSGVFQLEQKLSLLVFPLIFATIPKINAIKQKKMFSFFVLICFLASLYCLCAGLVNNYGRNKFGHVDLAYFTNQDLAGYIGSHSTYFSMHIAFSVFILAGHIKNKAADRRYLLVFLTLGVYFVLFLFLLASRIVLLAFLFISCVYVIRLVFRKRLGPYSFFAILAGLSLFLAASLKTDYFKSRFSEVYNFRGADLIGSNNENGVTQRVFFWKNGIEIISRSPLFGYGTGDANIEFKKQYERLLLEHPDYTPSVINAIHFFARHQYNAHNQFLQVLILFGFFGLAIFILLLARSYYIAFLERNVLHFSLLTIVFFACFTECILDRQIGIEFFSFFNCLFMFHSAPEVKE